MYRGVDLVFFQGTGQPFVLLAWQGKVHEALQGRVQVFGFWWGGQRG